MSKKRATIKDVNNWIKKNSKNTRTKNKNAMRGLHKTNPDKRIVTFPNDRNLTVTLGDYIFDYSRGNLVRLRDHTLDLRLLGTGANAQIVYRWACYLDAWHFTTHGWGPPHLHLILFNKDVGIIPIDLTHSGKLTFECRESNARVWIGDEKCRQSDFSKIHSIGWTSSTGFCREC